MQDNTNPSTRNANGEATEPPVTRTDTDNTDNTSSTLIEAPVKPGRKNPLDQHEFADGGGGGGAEAFRRKKKP